MKTIIIIAAIIFSFTIAPNDMLSGRWETKPSEKGNVTGVVFKNDSILEGFVNKKPFTSGTYRFTAKDSVLSFVDNGCNGVRGVYKVLFFNNSDSLRFKVISDSCDERSEGMQRLIMGRVKPR
jgi:putative heme iron utilization protein